MSHLIAPSILAADFGNLQSEVEMVNESQAQWFHIDIMDGVFVPNISFGFPVLKQIQKHAKKPLDVHLMIVNPDQFIKKFAEHGTEILTVHIEACNHLHRTVQAIHAEGMKAGVALNPHTNIDLLEDIIQDIELVCLMSVNPGFGGQKFIANTIDKVREVRALIDAHGLEIRLEVDGGISADNIAEIAAAGAATFVAGSAIFNAESYSAVIAEMRAELAAVAG